MDISASRSYHGVPVSRYGFLDHQAPIQEKDNRRFVVAVFGGSFAAWTYLDGSDALVRTLQACPAIHGRQVVILNVTLGGYKQPQQLMAVTYLCALGAHFDAVVNIDGFNEVTLPVLENIPKGVFPFYPRDWLLRAGEIPPPEIVRTIGKVAPLESLRRRCAGFFSLRGIGWSSTGNLVWLLSDRLLRGRIGLLEESVVRVNVTDTRYVTTGPYQAFPDRAAMFRSLAVVWRDSSIQMSRLANASGALNVHGLQPNQYVDGSKELTEREFSVAIDESSRFAPVAREGYPFLLEAGEELRSAGVDFLDLTMVFRDAEGEIYRDSCCHVNKRGSEIIATTVAGAICEALESRGAY